MKQDLDSGFTHLGRDSFLPKMVDISDKKACRRMARAACSIRLHEEIVRQLFGKGKVSTSTASPVSPKGAVFHTAVLAGIQAAKQTDRMIPLCHAVPLSACDIDIVLKGNSAHIECRVVSQYATGVEMEAIVGASAAAITIYDMCKGIHSEMTIENVRLLEKVKG